MTYASLHIQISVACLQLWQLSYIFIHVVIRYTSVQLFIMLFSFLYLQLFLLLLYAHCLYAELFPLHTHSPGRFLTTLDLHVQILELVSIVQVYDETVRFVKSWSFSLFYSGTLIFLASVLFSVLVISVQLLFQSWFIWYHAWLLICDIAVFDIHYSWDLL